FPRRNPYGCVSWPTYLLPFLDRDAAALAFRCAAAFGAARLRLAGALGSAFASAVPALPGRATGTSSPATRISTWLVRFKIGVARPSAPAVKRLSVRPA